jgi:hypothetical protein
MGNGSGVSRADLRSARLGRLRVLVPMTNAIAGIDLAGKKQMVVVTDLGSTVIARTPAACSIPCRATFISTGPRPARGRRQFLPRR